MQPLKDIQLFMLDMDGTIYNEDELIPGAMDFFTLLNRQGKEYVFMTNNSSKGKTSYVEKLQRLGVPATERQIASSVNATISYLKVNKPNARLYVVGTTSFVQELQNEGFEIVPIDCRDNDIDYVLLGFDTELNYEKIRGACYYVSRGFPYIATNCDLRCPVLDNKFIPDCGAIARMIELATDQQPMYLGKPSRTMVDAVVAEWGVPIDKSLVLETDSILILLWVSMPESCQSVCLRGKQLLKRLLIRNIDQICVFLLSRNYTRHYYRFVCFIAISNPRPL